MNTYAMINMARNLHYNVCCNFLEYLFQFRETAKHVRTTATDH